MSQHNRLIGAVLLGTAFATLPNGTGLALADGTIDPPHHRALGVLETAEPSDPGALVDIPDDALRRALEEALDKEQDAPITRGDMASLKDLTIDDGVDKLTGLEHAINLVSLACTNGGVSNLTPLMELSSLTRLSLQSNAILDITPLSELDSLTSLLLYGNDIADIAPLAALRSLTWLGLDLTHPLVFLSR